MSLSDEERVSKIYYGIRSLIKSINSVADLGYEIAWTDDFKTLKSHVDQLWHAFLGDSSNSMYWITGGDANNSITFESRGPWAVAVLNHLYDAQNKAEHKRQETEFPHTEKEFDPFNGFLDLASLLGHSHKAREAIYTAYSNTEFITYALRRYKDDLSRSLEGLNKVISDIQGCCFIIFSKDDVFARAYVLHRVLRLVFCGSRNTISLDATGKKLITSLNMHHDVSRAMSHETSLADIVDIDKMLKKNLSDVDRAFAALRLAGRRFHYDHQFEELVKAFGESSRAKLQPEFEKNKTLHAEKEKNSQEKYSKDKDRDERYIIHGYDHEYDESVLPVKRERPKRKQCDTQTGKPLKKGSKRG